MREMKPASEHAIRLVQFEGLPGSGKSTAAQRTAELLTREGFAVSLSGEGDTSHPADFESAALLTDAELSNQCRLCPSCRSAILQHMQLIDDQIIINYGSLFASLPERPSWEMVEFFTSRDVYNLPLRQFLAMTRSKWRIFAKNAVKNQQTHIFECCLLQNQVTTLMAVHDTPYDTILAQLQAILTNVSQLSPRVIFLQQANVDESLRAVIAERPRQWSEFVIAYVTGQAYGKRHNLSRDAEGMVQFYREMQDIQLKLLEDLKVDYVIIPDTLDWEKRYGLIIAYLTAG